MFVFDNVDGRSRVFASKASSQQLFSLPVDHREGEEWTVHGTESSVRHYPDQVLFGSKRFLMVHGTDTLMW